jgi:hypothetical protein
MNCETHTPLICFDGGPHRWIVSLALSTIRIQSNGSAHEVRCLRTAGKTLPSKSKLG